MRRLALLGSGVAAAAFLLSACRNGPGADASEASALRLAHESDVVSLDPILGNEDATLSVLSNSFEGLVGFDRDHTLRPTLAVSWENPDERTWIFRLRGNVRRHDGRLVGPADVKEALERARVEPSQIRSRLAAVESIAATGTDRLTVRTREADALLLQHLGGVPLAWPGAGEIPVGTGPYRILSWQKGRAVDMVAFEGYWGGRPAVERVRFLTLQPGPASLAALRKGDVDVVRRLPEDAAAMVGPGGPGDGASGAAGMVGPAGPGDGAAGRLAGSSGARVVSRPGLNTRFLFFDTRPGTKVPGVSGNPFADPRVRWAVSLAVDRAELVRLFSGAAVVARQSIPEGVFGHRPELPPLGRDVAKARTLLAEAGYSGGFEIPLVHSAVQATSEAVVAALTRQLGEVGIRLVPEARAWTDVLDGWRQAKVPFFVSGWIFETVDAVGFLRECVHSRDGVRGLGEYNAGFADARLDELIDENERMLDPAARNDQYGKLAALLHQEMPVVPLFVQVSLYGVSSRVRFAPRLDGWLRADEIELVR